MTAAPIVDRPILVDGPPDDRRLIGLALAVAATLHVVALFLPLPRANHLLTVVIDEHVEDPLLRFYPIPAPKLERERVPTTVAMERRETLPVEVPPELYVPVPGDSSSSIELATAPAWAGPDVVIGETEAPPAAPAVYPEDHEGLVRPVALPGRSSLAYPRLAIQARIEGRVVLRAVIGAEGRVEQIEVLEAPVPDLGFSEAAIDAVSRWEYRPATLQGRPVAVAFTVVVDFALD